MKRVTASLIILRCRFFIYKWALCLNEVDNGFADPFEDTECMEVGLVWGTKLGVKLWQNCADFKETLTGSMLE